MGDEPFDDLDRPSPRPSCADSPTTTSASPASHCRTWPRPAPESPRRAGSAHDRPLQPALKRRRGGRTIGAALAADFTSFHTPEAVGGSVIDRPEATRRGMAGAALESTPVRAGDRSGSRGGHARGEHHHPGAGARRRRSRSCSGSTSCRHTTTGSTRSTSRSGARRTTPRSSSTTSASPRSTPAPTPRSPPEGPRHRPVQLAAALLRAAGGADERRLPGAGEEAREAHRPLRQEHLQPEDEAVLRAVAVVHARSRQLPPGPLRPGRPAERAQDVGRGPSAGAKIKKDTGNPVGIGLAQEIDTAMAMRTIMYAWGAHEQDQAGNLTLKSKQTLDALKFVEGSTRRP